MTPGVPAKVISASCGLTAFAVALVAGLAADNTVESILIRAIVSMLVCQVIGWIVGSLGEKTISDAAEKYRKNSGSNAAGPGLAAAPATAGAVGGAGSRQ